MIKISSKFNFNKYDEYLKNKNNEKKEVDVMENKKVDDEVKAKNKTNYNLHTEMDILEKRIYGLLKPYFVKINSIDSNVKKLILNKEVAASIKDLKKKGYVFENEDKALEQLEIDYLKELGFKFSKNKGDEK